MIRKIVQIDEDKCDGCGLCASACAEGAIQIINGKARLISESYCDGLGACIGECPSDAITVIEREAEDFNKQAVERHLINLSDERDQESVCLSGEEENLACGCPGTMVRELKASQGVSESRGDVEREESSSLLRNWPVQMHLVPVNAPYLQGANLLLAADCVPFALADFHRRLLDGKILIVGCPKLDDAALYRDKLTAILRENDIRSLTVAYMEVPCCFGLVNLARQAIEDSGKNIPLSNVKVGIHGDMREAEYMRV